MIVYKYFLGCNSYIEVKARYKELVKVHHPDKPTGCHANFIELQSEYQMLGEGDYYPLRNISTFRDNVNVRFPRTPDEAYQKETVTNLSAEEIEKERIINHFKSIRVGDVMFDYIDELVKQAKKDNLNKLWIYQELAKKWDLTLEHFKYVTWLNKDKVSIARELFRKYQLSIV